MDTLKSYELSATKFLDKSTTTTNNLSSEASWNHHNATESDLDLVSNTKVDTVQDEVTVESWNNFIQAYSLGSIWSNDLPPPVAPSTYSLSSTDSSTGRDFGELGARLPSSADEIREVSIKYIVCVLLDCRCRNNFI